ncbi:MAG: hypothetical protein DRN14_02625 [Thermoplasmata archaeon]|nr:MAG: hypothetical protein DRN14_02625 [Thermoplasmata archaeon]
MKFVRIGRWVINLDKVECICINGDEIAFWFGVDNSIVISKSDKDAYRQATILIKRLEINYPSLKEKVV